MAKDGGGNRSAKTPMRVNAGGDMSGSRFNALNGIINEWDKYSNPVMGPIIREVNENNDTRQKQSVSRQV